MQINNNLRVGFAWPRGKATVMDGREEGVTECMCVGGGRGGQEVESKEGEGKGWFRESDGERERVVWRSTGHFEKTIIVATCTRLISSEG